MKFQRLQSVLLSPDKYSWFRFTVRGALYLAKIAKRDRKLFQCPKNRASGMEGH